MSNITVVEDTYSIERGLSFLVGHYRVGFRMTKLWFEKNRELFPSTTSYPKYLNYEETKSYIEVYMERSVLFEKSNACPGAFGLLFVRSHKRMIDLLSKAKLVKTTTVLNLDWHPDFLIKSDFISNLQSRTIYYYSLWNPDVLNEWGIQDRNAEALAKYEALMEEERVIAARHAKAQSMRVSKHFNLIIGWSMSEGRCMIRTADGANYEVDVDTYQKVLDAWQKTAPSHLVLLSDYRVIRPVW